MQRDTQHDTLYSVLDIKHTWFKRKPGSPKLFSESAVFSWIKTILNDAGYDVVKRNPQKDGHLIRDPYYIRDRKWMFCLTDEKSHRRFLHESYNAGEYIYLHYEEL